MRVEPMLPRDLPEILAIEQASFPIPWTHENFMHEMERNPFACNRVIRLPQGNIAAYASAWIVDSEVRINNIAVHVNYRRQGCAETLLSSLLDLGRTLGCGRAILEVRPSNLPAIKLYLKMGFREVGRRRAYYSDTREDALVMRVAL